MIDEKFLEGIGITDKDTVQKITEAYAADIKAEQDAAAAVQTQLDEASKTIQSYKDMDIDGIKASVEDYKQKLEQSEADRAAFEYRTKLIGADDVVQQFRTAHADAFAPNPGERAAVPTSGNLPSAMNGVEAAFYGMNPSLKKS